jgi:exopolysaccharide biosynthesis polyprenyl glycosylphosphotransferase
MQQLLRVLPVAALAFAVGRCVSYAVARRLASRRLQQVLIAGTGSVGIEFANTLEEHPEYGLQPIGFIDRSADGVLPLPLLGGVEELPQIAEAFGCRNVIVAFGETQEADMVSVLRDCEELGFELWVIPRLYELGVAAAGPHTLDIWGLPLIQIPHDHIRIGLRIAKRTLDIVVSSVLLVAGAPALAAVAVAVKLSGPGPVLFRQPRIGQHGREYELLKFRSMRPHEDCHTTWSEDDRATTIGRFIRKTSIDELPQLWNVLRGDMSLVGPRPERTHFVRELTGEIHGYEDRHRVPPGMTGWAQVNGLRGGETSISERIRFDNSYIEHWSVFWDVVIILRTIPAIVREVLSARRERSPKRRERPGFVYVAGRQEHQGEAVRSQTTDTSTSVRRAG